MSDERPGAFDDLVTRYRIVLNVGTMMPIDLAPGERRGLIIGHAILGADVEVVEFGPTLDHNEREREDFERVLSKQILEHAARLKADSNLYPSSKRPTRREIEDIGRVKGMLDAYRLLTGVPYSSFFNHARGVANHAEYTVTGGVAGDEDEDE